MAMDIQAKMVIREENINNAYRSDRAEPIKLMMPLPRGLMSFAKLERMKTQKRRGS